MSIFIDASAFVALANPKDPHHQEAKSLNRQISTRDITYTSNLVIFESTTIISMRVKRAKAVEFAETTINFSNVQIIKVDNDVEKQAWEIFKSIEKKDISFVDCSSFAICEKYKIDKVFTFDRDFKRFGFDLLE